VDVAYSYSIDKHHINVTPIIMPITIPPTTGPQEGLSAGVKIGIGLGELAGIILLVLYILTMRSRGEESKATDSPITRNEAAIAELESVDTMEIDELDSPKERNGAGPEAAMYAVHGFRETVEHEASKIVVEERHELAADSDAPEIHLGPHGKDVG
jgi:hypothetical protein